MRMVLVPSVPRALRRGHREAPQRRAGGWRVLVDGLVDILIDILVRILQPVLMERINLNVPTEVRARLRALASERGRSEGELARELLVAALVQVEREAEIAGIRDAYTAEARERHLALVEGMLELRRAPAAGRKGTASR